MTPKLTPERAVQLETKKMERLRWRLWYAFAESRYESFRKGYQWNRYYGKEVPIVNFDKIKEYCRHYWGKEPAEMTKLELTKHISQVKKWV